MFRMLLIAVVVVPLLAGCATWQPIPEERVIIVVSPTYPHALRVKVLDSYTQGPYTGPGTHRIPALITCIATGDRVSTGLDGWTNRPLRVPAEAERVTIIVRWHRHKLGGGSESDSHEYGVHLTHGITEFSAWVDTRPRL